MKRFLLYFSIFSLFSFGICKKEDANNNCPDPNDLDVVLDEYGWEARCVNVEGRLEEHRDGFLITIIATSDTDGNILTHEDKSEYNFVMYVKDVVVGQLCCNSSYPVAWNAKYCCSPINGGNNISHIEFTPVGVTDPDGIYQTTDKSHGAITVTGWDPRTLVMECAFSFTAYKLSNYFDQNSTVVATNSYKGNFHVKLDDWR